MDCFFCLLFDELINSISLALPELELSEDFEDLFSYLYCEVISNRFNYIVERREREILVYFLKFMISLMRLHT